MSKSMIYVQYRDGPKPKGTRVTPGFPSGMTKDFLLIEMAWQ